MWDLQTIKQMNDLEHARWKKQQDEKEEETPELDRADLDRQDFVDNEIFTLINRLRPDGVSEMDWNIEHITVVREAVQKVICHVFDCSEKYFYPYIEE